MSSPRFSPRLCDGPRSPTRVRIAVIGDVHFHWDETDLAYFDGSDYDLLLFVGDLARYAHSGGLQVAESLSRLSRPTLVIPGNHDGVRALQLLAEISGSRPMIRLLGRSQQRRCAALRRALAPISMVGYSRHEYSVRGLDFAILAARPHSMGGPALGCAPYLRRAFGVGSMEESAERLKDLVDECSAERIIFFAHNGPTGLGEGRSDIWGRDFRLEAGDFGDPDLRIAIDHARARSKKILAVVAGHMHHALAGGGERRWLVEREGLLYINAARTPRIFVRGGQRLRHHVALETDGCRTMAEEVLIPAG
jgi:uncharacterized protein (TIGR04168 family)